MSMLLVAIGMSAVPAKPGVWRTVKLANGTEVKVELKGDEFARYWQAADGRCYVPQAGTEFFEATDITQLQAAATQMRARKATAMRKAAAQNAAPEKASFVGKKKGLIILVEFADVAFQPEHTQALYNDIANKENFTHELGFKGSIHDYFYSQSSGQLDLTFDVVGPVKMPKGYSYYGSNSYYNNDIHVGAMVAEACNQVNDQVNYADYDWNNDGSMDQVVVMYAGRSEATGGDDDTIWPHESYLAYSDYGKYLYLDNTYINKYAVSSELGSYNTIDGIGTFCHEFSHCLGLPDFYDTDYSGAYGMQGWSIMDKGCYNGNTFVPAGYTAFEKMSCGWNELVELKDDQDITLRAMADGGEAYVIYNEANKNEYYFLENRQLKGWDAGLANDGLLITHVDYNKQVWNSNSPNDDPSHQRMAVVAADNSYVVGGEYGDIWPYTNADALTNSSKPAATLFNANADGSKLLNKKILGIKRNDDGTVSFKFRNYKEVELPEGVLFKETFTDCAGVGANDGVWAGSKVGQSSLVADNEGWVSAKGYGANECAMFGSNAQKGIATSPAITVNGKATLVFSAAPFAAEGTTLTVEDVNGTATLAETTFTMRKAQWTNFSTVITGSGTIKLKFTSPRRHFLDNVTVYDGEVTGIEGVTVNDNVKADGRIFSIDGRYMGTDFSRLGKGIYIMNGKKIIK